MSAYAIRSPAEPKYPKLFDATAATGVNKFETNYNEKRRDEKRCGTSSVPSSAAADPSTFSISLSAKTRRKNEKIMFMADHKERDRIINSDVEIVGPAKPFTVSVFNFSNRFASTASENSVSAGESGWWRAYIQ